MRTGCEFRSNTERILGVVQQKPQNDKRARRCYRCDPLGHVREHAPGADLALPCLASLLELQDVASLGSETSGLEFGDAASRSSALQVGVFAMPSQDAGILLDFQSGVFDWPPHRKAVMNGRRHRSSVWKWWGPVSAALSRPWRLLARPTVICGRRPSALPWSGRRPWRAACSGG